MHNYEIAIHYWWAFSISGSCAYVCILRLLQHPYPGYYIVTTNRQDQPKPPWNTGVGCPPVCAEFMSAYIYRTELCRLCCVCVCVSVGGCHCKWLKYLHMERSLQRFLQTMKKASRKGVSAVPSLSTSCIQIPAPHIHIHSFSTCTCYTLSSSHRHWPTPSLSSPIAT